MSELRVGCVSQSAIDQTLELWSRPMTAISCCRCASRDDRLSLQRDRLTLPLSWLSSWSVSSLAARHPFNQLRRFHPRRQR